MKDPASVLGCWRGFHFRSTPQLTRQLNLQTGQTIVSIFLAIKPPDLPIEMPDLDITAVHKLAGGLQGLRVCVGVDGFVGSYAIISIN
jgi:hypothetical protein